MMNRTSVVVGLGPTGLLYAAYELARNPSAKLILLDSRYTGNLRNPFGQSARGQILRLDYQQYAELDELSRLTNYRVDSRRYFQQRNEIRSYQHNDIKMFGRYTYYQISISVLQRLLIDFIIHFGTYYWWEERVQFVEYHFDFEHKETCLDEVLRKTRLDINKNNLVLVNSTGNRIDSDTLQVNPGEMREISTDHKNYITPQYHATGLFSGDPNFFRNLQQRIENLDHDYTIPELKVRRQLKKHGWKLSRPPRLRVFFHHNIAYLGTEIPADLYHSLETNRIFAKRQLKQYLKLLMRFATDEDITQQPYHVTHFEVTRAEVTSMVAYQKYKETNILELRVGCNAYLGHYQTGSAFSVAMTDIDHITRLLQITTFRELYYYAAHKLDIDIGSNLRAFRQLYPPERSTAIAALRAELIQNAHRISVEHNKNRVNKLFFAINEQALDYFLEQRVLQNRRCTLFREFFGGKKRDYRALEPRQSSFMLTAALSGSQNKNAIQAVLALLFNVNGAKLTEESTEALRQYTLGLLDSKQARLLKSPRKHSVVPPRFYTLSTEIRQLDSIERVVTFVTQRLRDIQSGKKLVAGYLFEALKLPKPVQDVLSIHHREIISTVEQKLLAEILWNDLGSRFYRKLVENLGDPQFYQTIENTLRLHIDKNTKGARFTKYKINTIIPLLFMTVFKEINLVRDFPVFFDELVRNFNDYFPRFTDVKFVHDSCNLMLRIHSVKVTLAETMQESVTIEDWIILAMEPFNLLHYICKFRGSDTYAWMPIIKRTFIESFIRILKDCSTEKVRLLTARLQQQIKHIEYHSYNFTAYLKEAIERLKQLQVESQAPIRYSLSAAEKPDEVAQSDSNPTETPAPLRHTPSSPTRCAAPGG